MKREPYPLHRETFYDGDTIRRVHRGKVYHLYAIGYTTSVVLPPLAGWMDIEDLPSRLKAKYEDPGYWVTTGIGGAARDWLADRLGESEWASVTWVWLVWKWQPGILPPAKRGPRKALRALRGTLSTGIRGIRR